MPADSSDGNFWLHQEDRRPLSAADSTTGPAPAGPAIHTHQDLAQAQQLEDVDNTWRVAREEVFGPVLVVIPWTDEDDVIAQANDTDYGLAAYVFTHDVRTALA